MKKSFIALLILGWLMPAGVAWAESPVLLSHTLTGYSKGDDSVVLNYTLTVKNQGNSSISSLTLTYVPLMIINKDQITLNIANVDPQAEVQIPFTITTPMFLDQTVFSQQPFFWAGTCTDTSGNLIEFPARSDERGVL